MDTENPPVTAIAREAGAVWAKVLDRAKTELPDSSYTMWCAMANRRWVLPSPTPP